MARKFLLLPALVIGLGMALLVWAEVRGARQAALFDARFRQAQDRLYQAKLRLYWAERHQSADDIERARKDSEEAWEEVLPLVEEYHWRHSSWPARLREEVRRRTGW
jgi:hypothetical protein